MLYLHPMASHSDGATLRRQHKTDGSCVNRPKADFTFIAPLSVQLNDSHTLKTPRSVFQDGSGRWSPCTLRQRQGSNATGSSAGAARASAHYNHCDRPAAYRHTADIDTTRSHHSSGHPMLVRLQADPRQHWRPHETAMCSQRACR